MLARMNDDPVPRSAGRASRDGDISVLELLGERAHRAIGTMLYTLLATLPVVLAAMLLAPGTLRSELLVVAALLVVVAALVPLHRRGRLDLVVAGLAAGLLAAGVGLGLTFGSVRSTGTLALVAAIVVCGLFLRPLALVATVLASILAVGALIVAQNAGWLPTPDYVVGLAHWAMYAAVLGAIALNLWAVRSVVVDAARRAREGEAWLGSVVRSMPAALITCTFPEGRVRDTNVAFERIFGLPSAQAQGRTATELGIWAEPREPFLERLGRDGRVQQLPARMRRAGGEVFDALISAELLDRQHERQVLATVTDVSAEVRARQALEGSEARFRTLFDSNPAALLVVDMDGGALLLANAAAERMFQISADALRGQNPGDRFFASAEARKEFWRRVRRDGRVLSVPLQLRRHDGEPFEALMSAEITEEAGERHALAAVVDVSAQARAHAAQRASEERFAKAFQSSPIGMTITRLTDGTYLEANAANERTLGYARAEIVGRTTVELDIWASAQERAQFASQVEREGRVMGYEARLRNRWGQQVEVRMYAELIELGGERCVLSSTLNVSEQKRDEELILEAARGVSAETGEAFFRRLVEHLARATGAERAYVGELLEGGRRMRTVARYADGTHGASVEYDLRGSPCEQVLARGELLVWERDVAAAFKQRDGLAEAGIQSYMGVPLVGVDGKPAGLMNVLSTHPLPRSARLEAVFRIFAARAEAELARLQREREIIALNASLEQRVRERTAELEAANRELEAFSYSVSHDLRAPLNGVDGLTQLLETRHAQALGAEALEYLRRTRSGVQRMRQIIENLLALSSVARSAVKPQPVDLSSMARSVAGELQRSRPERRVHWQIADGLTAYADPGLTHIVLTNLLGNAWKYSGKREEARVAFERAGSAGGAGGAGSPGGAGGRVEFVVRDNGVGFDMAYAEHLFQPFRRLHGQGEFEGTGVGLAIVRRVVERHGGSVRGEGCVGAGAAFHFSLPAAREGADPPAP